MEQHSLKRNGRSGNKSDRRTAPPAEEEESGH
jgi:hypothetical protein